MLPRPDAYSDVTFPESGACSHASLHLPLSPAAVFDGLRDLKGLAHWWPDARNIVAVPPGVYAAGDHALLELRRERVAVRVLAYKPGRRIVLSLLKRHSRLLVDIRVRPAGPGTLLDLAIESPSAPTLLAQVLLQLRMRRLCRDAVTRLARYLRATHAELPVVPNHDPAPCTSR